MICANPLVAQTASNSKAMVQPNFAGHIAVAGQAEEASAHIPWEKTAAAAMMPRPLPTPVSGYTPVEQRYPWTIAAAAKQMVQVKSRTKAKLKVR